MMSFKQKGIMNMLPENNQKKRRLFFSFFPSARGARRGIVVRFVRRRRRLRRRTQVIGQRFKKILVNAIIIFGSLNF